MVCAVDVLIVVAILGDFTLCLRFVLVFASAVARLSYGKVVAVQGQVSGRMGARGWFSRRVFASL